jgi:hypothetical protein
MAIIEEHLRDLLRTSLELTGLLYERLDPTGRITDVVPVAALLGAEHVGWQTQAEHDARPGSVSLSMRGESGEGLTLTPSIMRRAALRQDAPRLAEELTVLLRRQLRG